ncbi:hypothetical protein EDL79_03960 [Ehrlichia ruminantium]|uniref:Uncharacterized protein n=1 Tax=Ehrlichia ruminantium TaxID=779 RepID=A0AAE6Q9H7_EHRRU|nr:hypothetical protein EDL81_03950 [Ehrlichia ruminantium]QGR03691.1 hypothetical protein EDL80_03950 [Ehrlichia ruminantium]QGR04618.1 hypothetical protein EDL79_03960 [Ehrlichia ruminantium]
MFYITRDVFCVDRLCIQSIYAVMVEFFLSVYFRYDVICEYIYDITILIQEYILMGDILMFK